MPPQPSPPASDPLPPPELAGATRREVRIEGRRIALLDFGAGALGDAAPLALLHHANGFCKGVLGLVARGLRGRYRVLAMDARGHGDSDPAPPEEGYAWSGFARDVERVAARLCQETGRPRVALGLGHSFGGTSMLGAAALAPERFERLVLVDPVVPAHGESARTPERQAHVEEMVRRARRRRAAWPSFAEARAWLGERALFEGWDPRAFLLYLHDGLRRAADGGVALKCDPEVEAEVFLRGDEIDVAALASRVRVPTLFLWAARGSFSRPVYEALAAGIPGARVEAVAAGHLVPMERPELVTEAALRFAGLAPAAGSVGVPG